MATATPRQLTPMRAPTSPSAPDPADPFAAMGGGVRLPNGDWVPANHPGAQGQPGFKPDPTTFVSGPGPDGTVNVQPPGLQPAASPAPVGPAAPTAAAPAAAPASPAQPYQDALLKLLNDSQQAPSLNDPTLKAQSDAFAVGQQRAAERQRAEAAERMSLQGTAGINSGAFDSDLTGINERAGENMAAFNANLVGNAGQQQLQKLTTALQLMGADRNSAEGRALQERIAQLQAQLQREGLAQQKSQFQTDADLRRYGIDKQTGLGERDLSLRDKLGSGGLNLGLLQALIGNQNFNNQLGANLGMFNANLNQTALLQMLGGL